MGKLAKQLQGQGQAKVVGKAPKKMDPKQCACGGMVKKPKEKK